MALCRLTPVLEPQARAVHTNTTFYFTLQFFFPCPFAHLDRKRCNTTQVQFQAVLFACILGHSSDNT